MTSRRALVPAVAAIALGLSGCGALTSDDSSGASGSGGSGGSSTVVTGLYPLQYVAQRVAGDAFEVENLTQPGGEPHDLELGVGQTAALSDAALLVYVDSLQPAVDEAAEEVGGPELLDAAEVVDLAPFEDEHDEHSEEEHGEDEHSAEEHSDEEHGEDEHSEEDHSDHDHGELDPHFWHDPARMAALGDAVAERLSEIDPDRAEDFEERAADLRSDLEALDEEFVSGLADCEITTVVTNHDAFGYLEGYGLELASINGISPDAEPSPAALAALQDLIDETGITTVFSETLVSPQAAEVLASDAGVDTAVLDTIEGLTDETADEDYLSLMRSNLAALQEANRC
ncbi:zinc transport system substrate-binding protein [Nocardioides marinisabuli]|uniref:Zinc transport system substrate-binding protein n=1 Tax=Nocardioides marinisabuli TaxID=419476 RepID=A0A7Y9F4W9_9ACTN|nr:metal ABC transporter substrate-binding protein [Nocardioides marinisabuli]NYD59456.1 zinc transport system substrate-binding protein [Nocardioides marinisabuli]